jgi:hypothetical protein
MPDLPPHHPVFGDSPVYALQTPVLPQLHDPRVHRRSHQQLHRLPADRQRVYQVRQHDLPEQRGLLSPRHHSKLRRVRRLYPQRLPEVFRRLPVVHKGHGLPGSHNHDPGLHHLQRAVQVQLLFGRLLQDASRRLHRHPVEHELSACRQQQPMHPMLSQLHPARRGVSGALLHDHPAV